MSPIEQPIDLPHPEVIAKLASIDRARLAADDRLNYELFDRRLKDDIEEAGRLLRLVRVDESAASPSFIGVPSAAWSRCRTGSHSRYARAS